MNYKIALVAVSDIVPSIDRLYSYFIPTEFEDIIVKGSRVVVPFGYSNKKKKGVVFDITDSAPTSVLKPIYSVVDSSALLSDEDIALAEFLKSRCFCTYYDAFKVILPVGLGVSLSELYTANPQADPSLLTPECEELYLYILANEAILSTDIHRLFGEKSKENIKKLIKEDYVYAKPVTKRRAGDITEKIAVLAADGETVSDYISKYYRQRAKESAVLSALSENGELSVKEISYLTGATLATVKSLAKKGFLYVREDEVFRKPKIEKGEKSSIELSEEQQNVYDILLYNSKKTGVSLLYGITGSGKTHVFLKLADTLLKEDKSLIILVPEISLTSQMVTKFYSRYGENVALIHSALSVGERMDEWKRIKSGKAKIIIGTRSAVFAPAVNLGLIVIDEEQEHTYKSEMSPRFSAKDVAKFRAVYNNAHIILSSATPSIESFYNAKNGKYGYAELETRYNNTSLPDVTVVDMREELKNGNSSIISDRLRDEIEKNLISKKQTVLFINRRGYNSVVSCRSCGYVEKCEHCNIALTYHSKNGRLMCHYCGFSKEKPDVCPSCGFPRMSYLGSGTQKAEAELAMLFPQARIVRMDADTTMRKSSHEKIIGDFAKGKYDILLGTQMITKGLDFPNVTLAGVLLADMSLYSDDYRANERTFSLLTQVVGRAGRGSDEGRAIIQTYTPDNPIINLAITQNYKSFFDKEIMFRKNLLYPPYCDICQIVFTGEDEKQTENISFRFTDKLKETLADKNLPVKGYGPAPCAIAKINNKYRYRLLLKCKNSKEIRKLLLSLTNEIYNDKISKNIQITIDMNPETIS